jgi:putative transposase
MKFEPNHVYHIYNQGNNKQPIFLSDFDYELFLNNVKTLIIPYADLICYCLMPNHFHFLAYTKQESCVAVKQGGLIIDALINSIRKLLSGYARVFNKRYERSGSLFRQKTKIKDITGLVRKEDHLYTPEDYCRNCFRYIHENPVAAGIVIHPGDWKWSSYNFYAGIEDSDLCNKQLAKKFCGYDSLISCEIEVPYSIWKKILEEDLDSF